MPLESSITIVIMCIVKKGKGVGASLGWALALPANIRLG